VAYSLFYTNAPSPSDKTPDFQALPPLRFDTMGEAITAACNFIKSNHLAWRIESPSGFVMEKADIEIECLRRRDAATNEPKTRGAANPRLGATISEKL
jgi:hypothetical protein